MNKKQLEQKYNVDIFKDSNFDAKSKYWVALGNENKDLFVEGYTLKEIEKKLKDYVNEKSTNL